MFQFETRVFERRGLEEIIAFNREKNRNKILRNGNICTYFIKMFSPHTYLYYKT